ncbi:hypothetical protein [Sphingosinicella sp. BN140058]|uniref:hypothetical protein n=1 Tax=Sphingosinicella sp. BN140058 TaxID=1892855 RepID=UPI0010102352|nr:hypothetical protein [Sphingosinicella sp. BN140058]QAY76408.1 hypothetical protein ETR14_07815 [Sphingosinicella sp. BN140058]
MKVRLGRRVAVQTLIACLLFFPFVDLWMGILARLVPGAGQPAVVAILLGTAMAVLCVWQVPKLVRRVRTTDRRRR